MCGHILGGELERVSNITICCFLKRVEGNTQALLPSDPVGAEGEARLGGQGSGSMGRGQERRGGWKAKGRRQRRQRTALLGAGG